MLKVGLTGNIGSGKTTVARIFEKLGVRIYYSDSESKKFLDQPEVIKRLQEAFGSGVVDPNGLINKAALAKVVFGNQEQLLQLNSLLHPLVMEDYLQWCKHMTTESYTILEAAILFESGIEDQFDRIIHVSAPEETAIARVVSRDRVTDDEVRQRMNFQMSDAKKATLSDFVIRNDGLQLVIPQVLTIHQELLKVGT
jgi:dephospho-CoA kinase